MVDTPMNVSVHQDKSGDLVLARTFPHQFTPNSKYYATKTIWFLEEIVNRGIKLLIIDTVEHIGYLFTKVLQRNKFECLRKNIMGW